MFQPQAAAPSPVVAAPAPAPAKKEPVKKVKKGTSLFVYVSACHNSSLIGDRKYRICVSREKVRASKVHRFLVALSRLQLKLLIGKTAENCEHLHKVVEQLR